MTLAAGEFMRRFLLHTLPPGFQRIRYFGFLANRFRKEKLELCRKLLTIVTVLLPEPTACEVPEAPSFRFCPRCHTGILIRIALVPPYLWPQRPPDTS
jgi:Putative transposase